MEVREDIDTVSSLAGGEGGYVVVGAAIGTDERAGIDGGGGTGGTVMVSFVAVKGSSSNMEGGAVVFGVSPTTDILC